MTSLLKELLITENKKDAARRMIKPMLIQGTYTQEEIEKIMMRRLGIKPSTADTYYHMIDKEVKRDNTKTVDGNDDFKNTAPERETEEEPENVIEPDVEFDDNGEVVGGFENMDKDQFIVKDNPNRRGVIRRIKNAHLIYKRQNETGTFDELWQFNTSSNMIDALDIQRDILSATDIAPRQKTSEDGSQSYSMYTMGDVQFLEITGLPQ